MGKDANYYIKIILKVIILLLAVLGIFLTYKLAVFYMPFIIAMIIASVVEPIIKVIMKFAKVKRKTAAIVTLALVLLVLGSLITLTMTIVVSETTNLLSNLNVYFDDAYKWGTEFINDNMNKMVISEELLQVLQNSLTGLIDTAKVVIVNMLTVLINTITSVPTMITYIFLTILAIIFICFDREYLPNIIKGQVPKKWFEKAKEIINQMCSISFKYIKAEAKLSFICFILVLIGLMVFDMCGLDVKYPITMAIIIGFIDLLPLFGAGAVMVPWAMYLAITGNTSLALAIFALWIVWAVIKQFSEPKMVSKEMGMHPIFTLIGMYTGFKLLGVLGLIIGPIIFLILKNIFKELINKGILKSFLEME